MDTSLSWIKAYVPDLDVTAQEYTDAMTLTGTKVEGFKELDADLDKIVVGQIEKIEKHPDADKLVVCQPFFCQIFFIFYSLNNDTILQQFSRIILFFSLFTKNQKCLTIDLEVVL